LALTGHYPFGEGPPVTSRLVRRIALDFARAGTSSHCQG